jgi:hypothetical protein
MPPEWLQEIFNDEVPSYLAVLLSPLDYDHAMAALGPSDVATSSNACLGRASPLSGQVAIQLPDVSPCVVEASVAECALPAPPTARANKRKGQSGGIPPNKIYVCNLKAEGYALGVGEGGKPTKPQGTKGKQHRQLPASKR